MKNNKDHRFFHSKCGTFTCNDTIEHTRQYYLDWGVMYCEGCKQEITHVEDEEYYDEM